MNTEKNALMAILNINWLKPFSNLHWFLMIKNCKLILILHFVLFRIMIWREGSLDILLMKQEIKVGRQEARHVET